MAKYAGKVGYGESAETSPGVWSDQITERECYGDVIRNDRMFNQNEQPSGDLRLNNSISIVADAYASEHYFAIRYVEFGGALWTVTHVEVRRPRLILQLGEVYNGPTPAP